MIKKSYTEDEVAKILEKVPIRTGWDFSHMKTRRQTVPWDYIEVVKKYVAKTDKVLDIGTGGGERFNTLAEYIKEGVGVDVDEDMIQKANESCPQNMVYLCDGKELKKVVNEFDIVVNRHAPFDTASITDHLRDDGYFITQQVGEKNMSNIQAVIGTNSRPPSITRAHFKGEALEVVAFLEYDVYYDVLNIESLIFWLNALDMVHTGMEGSLAIQELGKLNQILATGVEDGVFRTNEHRYLVIAQKRR